MKSFAHMSYKFFRLLETIFSSGKAMSAYLLYDKELFACWSCHTPLTGLLGPDLSPIGHPSAILGWRMHDRISSQLPHFQNLNTGWLINGIVIPRGVGYNPMLVLSMHKSLIECNHRGGGHTIYKFIIITCSIRALVVASWHQGTLTSLISVLILET